MPPYGNQPQTLAYRVEIDQSSLSEAAQQVQLAVGSAMSSAIASVSGFADRAHATSSVAMGSAAGHLAFLEQQRSKIISAPGAPQTGGTGLTSVLQSVAIRAGFMDPGFSQTRGGMLSAAAQTLREVQASIPEMISRGGHAVSGAMGWASLIGLVPGFQPLGMALSAGQTLMDMSLAGVDRFNEREDMRRYLTRYGSAREVTKELEESVRGMRNISFGEATMVARSALLNIGPENMNRDTARAAVMDSITDWRVAGKTMGLSKEDTIEELGSLYRLGIRPGAGIQQYTATVSAAASALGVSTASLNQAGVQAGGSGMVLGYDALASQNQFMIQTAMVGEALRSGTMSRQTLTMAAGFYGPQADQAMSAAQGWQASMRTLAETGFGRAMTMGSMRGGGGDASSLFRAAAGASLQEMVEFPVTAKRNFDPAKLGMQLGSVVSQHLTSMGVSPTEDALTSQFMSMFPSQFQTEGSARMAAMSFLHPEIEGRARATEQRKLMVARAESGEAAHPLAVAMDRGVGNAGTFMEYLWRGSVDKDGRARSPMNDAEYGSGLRSVGRFASTSFDETFGSWTRAAKHGIYRLFGGERPETEADMQELVSRKEVRAMRGEDFAEMQRGSSAILDAAGKYYEGVTSFDLDKRTDSAKRARNEIVDRAYSRDRSRNDEALDKLQYRLSDEAGVSLSTDAIKGLVAESTTFMDKLSGASREERKTLIAERAENLRTMETFKGLSSEQAQKVVELTSKSSLNGIFTLDERKKVTELNRGAAFDTAITTALNDDVERSGVLKHMFKEGSAAAKYIDEQKGKLDPKKLSEVLSMARRNDEFREDWMKETQGSDLTATQAALQEIASVGTQDVVNSKASADKAPGSSGGPKADQIDRLIESQTALTQKITNLIERLPK